MIAYGGTSDKQRSVVRQKRPRKASFADPPWNVDASALAGDRRSDVPENHLVRANRRGCGDRLDLRAAFGHRIADADRSHCLHLDLMVKMVLYEMAFAANGFPRRMVSRHAASRIQFDGLDAVASPMREVCCYEFWNRIVPFADDWNKQVLHAACEQQLLCRRPRRPRRETAIAAVSASRPPDGEGGDASAASG